ncbi:Protein of unknown function [Bacillus cytotoxicus]|uniref:Uncharacterized protein n=1 Tax=Bacillus cytotoxicus TaxID=580165 RepID=A0AAX2CFV8_9BACI|nr:Protein of unknown function [Bacillus cytotoxicus]
MEAICLMAHSLDSAVRSGITIA